MANQISTHNLGKYHHIKKQRVRKKITPIHRSKMGKSSPICLKYLDIFIQNSKLFNELMKT